MEIMIVVAIIGLLAAIAIPNFVKARNTAQATGCINNLRQIDAAKQTWALEKGQGPDATPQEADLLQYIKADRNGKIPACPAGGQYTINSVGTLPTCSLSTLTGSGQTPHVIP